MPKNLVKGRYIPYPFWHTAKDEDIFTKDFFWDVKIEKLNKKNDAKFIIERILEYGDLEHLNWLFMTYPKDTIIDVIKQSRRISPKVANFWKIYLNIKGKIQCLDQQSLKMREKIWPH